MKTMIRRTGSASRAGRELSYRELACEFQQGRMQLDERVQHLLLRDDVVVKQTKPVCTYAPANNPADEHTLGGQEYDHDNRD